MRENSYGQVKRLSFLRRILDDLAGSLGSLGEPDRRPSVLDVGGGLGTYVSVPLAEAYPAIDFVSVDSDVATIADAQQRNRVPNLSFGLPDSVEAGRRFDLIIASEVIEHVEHPHEFLLWLHSHLAEQGRIAVTLPNGYGPFEATKLVEATLYVAGPLRLVRWVRRRLKNRKAPLSTLAVSPHINFFSFADIERVFGRAGFRIELYRARSFACGIGLDQLMRGRLARWNARVADRLPPWAVSGWMFVLIPGAPATAAEPWRRNGWNRFRRRLNERRYGLPVTSAE